MDFFSLFDPSEGQKPNPDDSRQREGPKGRRRRRKCGNKSDMLPEESSFLCEPDLSTEVLVRDGGYIDSFIVHSEVNEDSKTKTTPSKKTRRKRNKISPFKELESTIGWNSPEPKVTLNNIQSVKKPNNEPIGKNVNDLKSNVSEVKAEVKTNNMEAYEKFGEKMVNKVIEKLENVNITENWSEFNQDIFNDESEVSDDDYNSSEQEFGDVPCLPPEPRFGNVEYKLHLVAPSERRFQHLVTQLKWRLSSGGGSAVYVLGVRDSGSAVGLGAKALNSSLMAIHKMCQVLNAVVGKVTAKRISPHRAVAEVLIRKISETNQSVELRIAVMGANEAGKSTLVGVLTQGELDNGRGSARLNMFRHLHEVRSGNTSSLSHEILGFDSKGNVVNYGCSSLMTAERIGELCSKLVCFIDLAGHSKYQRTTVHGLSGYSPHYVMLVVSATAGITPITEEHIDLLLALDLPFFTVVSKCEIDSNGITSVMDKLQVILKERNMKPILISDEVDARNCVGPKTLILDSLDKNSYKEECELENVPVFPVSCVRGNGLSALHAYLLALEAPGDTKQVDYEHEPAEFQIDEIFHVGDSSGPILGGLLTRGQIYEGDSMLIGPMDTGEFIQTTVRTIYRNRVPKDTVKAGQSASLGLQTDVKNLRQGMVLLAKCKCKESGKNGWDESKRKNSDHKNIQDNICCNDLQCKDEPRGCFYFQANIHLLRHSSDYISPGFQCTVHIGNVRQTAIVEGILAPDSRLLLNQSASVLFRFLRNPEFIRQSTTLLLRASSRTTAVGRLTQLFPHEVDP